MPEMSRIRLQIQNLLADTKVLSQRGILCLFGFFALVIAVAMRTAVDLTLNAMIDECKTKTKVDSSSFIWFYDNSKKLQEQHCEALWSDDMQKAIHFAFYVGFVLAQIPGAVLAQKYGGKIVLALSVSSSALLTFLTPLIVACGGGGGGLGLIMLRFLLGITEAPIDAALTVLLVRWVPKGERGKLAVLALSGGQAGTIFSNAFMEFASNHTQWQSIFYIYGLFAFLWTMAFILLCFDTPESHPYITVEEEQYLKERIRSDFSLNHSMDAPWKDISKSISVWALVAASIFTINEHDGYPSLVVGDLTPTTIESFENTASFTQEHSASFLNWLMALTTGCVGDILVDREVLTTTEARKLMTTITTVCPKLFIDLTTCLRASDENAEIHSQLNVALSIMGALYAGIKLNPLDMSPNYAGILMAIANSFSSAFVACKPFLEEFVGKYGPVMNDASIVMGIIGTTMLSSEIQGFNNLPIQVETTSVEEDDGEEETILRNEVINEVN